MQDGIKRAVDHCLRNVGDLHVVVGPPTWRPSDGVGSKVWYFIVATAGNNKRFRCDQFIMGEGMNVDEMRTSIIVEFVQRRPIVIHDMGDEVSMVRLCEILWPGKRISRLRAAVEAEAAAH